MKILVLGASGQVAQSLSAAASPGHDLVTLGRPDGDLCNPLMPGRVLDQHRPDIVINAAAYTAVDKAEGDEAAAEELNASGPGRLAEACAALGCPIVHYSTDYVFDGTKPSPYFETDPTAPLGVYGRTKLAGEHAVANATPDHIILRTAWVYSPYGGNFVKSMIRLGNERDSLSIVDDQIGNPSYAPHLADATLSICEQLLNGASHRGVFHMTGGGETSWYGFAKAIFETAGELVSKTPVLAPIPSSEYPTPAKRPANSRLDGTRLKTCFNIALPHWSEGLQDCMRALKSTQE